MFYSLNFTFNDVINGNFFEFLGDILSNIWGFICNVVGTLIAGLSILSGISSTSFMLTGFAPAVMSTSVLIVLTVSIVKCLTFQQHQ